MGGGSRPFFFLGLSGNRGEGAGRGGGEEGKGKMKMGHRVRFARTKKESPCLKMARARVRGSF